MNQELLNQSAVVQAGDELLESILDSLGACVAVVNENLDVVYWNRQAEEIFGVRPEEAISRSVLVLDVGLPIADISPLLQAAAQSAEPHSRQQMTVDALNRRGRPIRLRLTIDVLPTPESDEEGRKIIVRMEPVEGSP